MLDDFAAVKVTPSTAPQAPSVAKAPPEPAPPAPLAPPEDPFSTEDFAKDLEAGMAQLLGELENNVSPPRLLEYTSFGGRYQLTGPAL
jgi:peroxin-19